MYSTIPPAIAHSAIPAAQHSPKAIRSLKGHDPIESRGLLLRFSRGAAATALML
jgi:hypothetical protein